MVKTATLFEAYPGKSRKNLKKLKCILIVDMLILNFQVISEITLPSLLILALYLRLWHNERSLHTMFALQGSLFVFLFPAFGVQHIMLNHKQNIVDYHHNS